MQEERSGSIGNLANSFLLPAIRVARTIAVKALALGDQKVAEIFNNEAEKLSARATEAGLKLEGDTTIETNKT